VIPPVIEARDLHVDIPLPHGRLHAVRGVSLTVAAGESVGLVGESGSGKSLTLRALLGLLPRPAKITSGSVLIDGEDVTGLPPQRLRRRLTDTMSMVFQDSLTALNPVMRVGDQIAEAPRRKLGMSRTAARSTAIELMAKVGIPDPARRYGHYPHEMSGGMRQRVCIAIALSTRPRVILADEPTTALDVTIQARVLEVLRRLRQDEHVGLLLVSHDLAVVGQTCSRLYVMYAGRIVESGHLAELTMVPRHPYTFALLRSVPDPDRRVTRLLSIPGQQPDLRLPVVGCSFAPRCPFAADECRVAEPDLVETGERATACVRADTADRWADEVAVEGAGLR
jgi:oligopeptide/dipeptide ABC transporter ATP-binding protein